MYLKSLTLKGFKSFADRTVMKFEPGVAAVVGPNGSGKSNISDAVLWVLGERNAKNLRGQSMEDVIFSGSSARKPVSVAEVELLLDNSDGTLPVEFDEVSIGRRMYRSGESEYLINGTVVRRMDVLDILHDSGLGTGTNSIISQGNLDSVLSSKPEDRRALIEEAAGVLKHKERKAKSERKLAQMDNHLARVYDITAEVERQLKPLERKAKRALAYKDLSAELADLKLQLSVDDLRILQNQWNQTLEKESQLSGESEELKFALQEAERALDELQQQLQTRGDKENNLNVGYRRAQNAHERFNSTLMLLREKRRIALSDVERATRAFEESKMNRAEAKRELEVTLAQQKETDDAFAAAQASLEELESAYAQAVDERNALRKHIDTLMAEQRAFTHTIETIQATQEALRENLSERRARAQVIETHLADAHIRLNQAKAESQNAQASLVALSDSYTEEKEKEERARSAQNAALKSREEARQALDEARQRFTQASAERVALEELERASNASNAALSWLTDSSQEWALAYKPLVNAVSAPSHLESVVEVLLGSDIHALLLSEQACPEEMISKLLGQRVTGEVVLLCEQSASQQKEASLPYNSLLDELTIDASYQNAIEALLGNVYICDSFVEALAAQRKYPGVARFVSVDGVVVGAHGKITCIQKTEADKANSTLARRRALETATAQEKAYELAHAQAQEELRAIEDKLHHTQAETLRCSEMVAQLKGRLEAAEHEATRSAEALSSLQNEYTRLEKEQEENNQFLFKAQPDSDNLDEELARAQVSLETNQTKVDALQNALSPMQKRIVEFSEKLSDARLEAARLSERAAYAKRMVSSRKQEIVSIVRTHDEAQQRIRLAHIAVQRVEPLLKVLSELAQSSSQLALDLEARSDEAQAQSRSLHEQITHATKAVREAHERFDRCAGSIAELRIEKGRLEIQVEAAIKVIVEDCSTSLETALLLDELVDRAEVLQRAGSLERRIKNMGTINPDAAEEYEQVRERYEYLSAQLADMKMARQSLSRIVAVIDERMKDDFLNTFNQVNDNFAEIFATLFPGGQAHLSLVDPDDLDNTGVDVHAQPVGKRIKKMSLLSGGEKSMTALALLFAVYRIRQTPFYILDEVEAALDDTNLRRLISYLETIRSNTQFILITHQRRTMESADILYGVSMQADGVTKVLSQKLEQAISKEG